MPTIPNHLGNATKNHNEITPHNCQNGYLQKKKNTGEKKEKNKRNISVVKDVEKKYICTVGRNVNCCNRYGSSPEH